MTPRTRAMPEGAKTTQEWIVVGDLTVDPRYQRPLSENRVKKMIREFDPDLIGVLLCSRRDDDTIVVLDGQQRRETVARMWGVKQKVPCLVYHGLSVEQEAQIFVGFNEERTKPRAIEQFRAKVVAGDEACVAIDRLLRERGLRATTGNQAKTVQSIKTAEKVYRNAGPDVFAETLDVLLAAGMGDDEPIPGEFIEAVALLLSRHGHVLDNARLLRTLQDTIPRRVVATARTMKAEVYTTGSTVNVVVARLVLDRYNKGLRSKVEWVESGGGRAFWEPMR